MAWDYIKKDKSFLARPTRPCLPRSRGRVPATKGRFTFPLENPPYPRKVLFGIIVLSPRHLLAIAYRTYGALIAQEENTKDTDPLGGRISKFIKQTP